MNEDIRYTRKKRKYKITLASPSPWMLCSRPDAPAAAQPPRPSLTSQKVPSRDVFIMFEMPIAVPGRALGPACAPDRTKHMVTSLGQFPGTVGVLITRIRSNPDSPAALLISSSDSCCVTKARSRSPLDFSWGRKAVPGTSISLLKTVRSCEKCLPRRGIPRD